MKKVLKVLTLPFLLIGCNGKGEEPAEVNPPAEVNLYTDWYNELETEFTITTQKQLVGFAELVNGGNSFIGKTIKLGANIALNDTANWLDWANNPPDNKWVPIGNLSKWFSGTFDGDGFVISGIYINSSDGYQGLFGRNSGIVKNLGITASYIKGDSIVGGLIGECWRYCEIHDSYSVSIVEGQTDVGGLVGMSGGSINNNHFSGKVTGKVNVGGLVGRGYHEKISNSYSKGEVTGEKNIGGLVGIYGTYEPQVTGHVRTTYIGGNIINSYSTGTVAGQNYVGGLAGVNSDGNVTNSYSACKVTGQNYVGGLIGVSHIFSAGSLILSGNITNSYYNTETSGQSDEGKGEGKTTEDMRLKATYVGWDFDEIWNINGAINNGYPHLAAP